ncbi:hypothetical protein A1D22_00455 [Pasteurellaceae bacterium LFhippo2]|nr:hypothetical protein [Pasteurellaceae bacterium LFhippo2]
MEYLSGWTLWLILGFALLILELVIPGVFVMWLGFAAIIVALFVGLVSDISFAIQVTIFAILSIVFSLAWWKYQHSKDEIDDRQTELNSRDHVMLGTRGTIVEILENGVARGKFGDTTWRVMGENLQVGDTVEVIRVDGITLFVK